jgi:hypothetical protein
MPLMGDLAGETITVGTVAIGISPYRPAKGQSSPTLKVGAAEIVVNSGGPIRVRKDGTDPTATVGSLVYAGGTIALTNWAEVRDCRFIRDSSATADAVLQVAPAIGYLS